MVAVAVDGARLEVAQVRAHIEAHHVDVIVRVSVDRDELVICHLPDWGQAAELKVCATPEDPRDSFSCNIEQVAIVAELSVFAAKHSNGFCVQDCHRRGMPSSHLTCCDYDLPPRATSF